MIRIVFAIAFIALLVTSCSSDRKKDTISSYIRYVRRLPAGQEPKLTKLEEVKAIKAADSLMLLAADYSKGLKTTLAVDTILSNITKDILYNTALLTKTNQRLDSLALLQGKFKDDPFFEQYTKSFKDLKSFTEQQLIELKYMKYQFNRYHKDPDEVLSHQIDCEYSLGVAMADSTKKIKKQTFFLSPDYRRVQAVH